MEVVDALLCADFELCDLVAWVIVNLHPRRENKFDVSVYMVDHSEFERRRKVFFQYSPYIFNLLFSILIYSNDLTSFKDTFPLVSLSSR